MAASIFCRYECKSLRAKTKVNTGLCTSVLGSIVGDSNAETEQLSPSYSLLPTNFCSAALGWARSDDPAPVQDILITYYKSEGLQAESTSRDMQGATVFLEHVFLPKRRRIWINHNTINTILR